MTCCSWNLRHTPRQVARSAEFCYSRRPMLEIPIEIDMFTPTAEIAKHVCPQSPISSLNMGKEAFKFSQFFGTGTGCTSMSEAQARRAHSSCSKVALTISVEPSCANFQKGIAASVQGIHVSKGLYLAWVPWCFFRSVPQAQIFCRPPILIPMPNDCQVG